MNQTLNGEVFHLSMEQRDEHEIQENTEAFWKERVEGEIESLLELIESDFIEVGGHYGIEQLLEDPGTWGSMGVDEQQVLLGALGNFLGVDLSNFPSGQIARKYREKGVVGQSSEGGAEVLVLRTEFPQLEVHVMDYANPEVGRRYDLVRVM